MDLVEIAVVVNITTTKKNAWFVGGSWKSLLTMHDDI